MNHDYLSTTHLPRAGIWSPPSVENWIAGRRAAYAPSVQRLPLKQLESWAFQGDPRCITHRSGRFFAVEGLSVKSDFGPVKSWEQPVIRQPEVGILGILTRVNRGVRHFLMHAKGEPGLVNWVQLAPSVQVTESNYSRVHGGLHTLFLDYFTKPEHGRVLVDQLQIEMGCRFLHKMNRNMVLEIDDDLELPDHFCWLAMGEIKNLLRQSNQVNADARSVLSCIPFVTRDASPDFAAPVSEFARHLLASALDRTGGRHTQEELQEWLAEFRNRYPINLQRRPIDQLRGWECDELEIRHESGSFFSVIGAEVRAPHREVPRWHQPLFKQASCSLHGFLLQRICGIMHFLVQACLAPGNRRIFELGPTVLTSEYGAQSSDGLDSRTRFVDVFREAPREWIRYDAIQSEEGGRFYHCQNRCIILELPPDTSLSASATHRWMTLRQIQNFIALGEFSMEARSLIACLDLGESA
jgi:dTDP-4-dehydro-6-deoxy-alpha-D-glucopyranose 2,3-dehydratase